MILRFFIELFFTMLARFFFCVLVLYVFFSTVCSGQGKMLCRIGNDTISSEEFLLYRTSLQDSCNFDCFLFMKLKAADAVSKGWDTLPELRHECKILQNRMLKSVFLDTVKVQSVWKNVHEDREKRLLTNEWVKFETITIRLSQHASGSKLQQAYSAIDSVYRALLHDTSFEQLKGGTITSVWYPINGVLKEFSVVLSRLQVGECSQPFLSPLGWHIVKLIDRQNEVNSHADILPDSSYYLKKLMTGNLIKDHQIYNDWIAGDLNKNPYVALKMKWIKDKYLANYWDDRCHSIWSDLDEGMLASYFVEHKNDYTWELPHFKGAVVFCQHKKTVKRIKKILKKQPFDDWGKVLAEKMREDSTLSAKVEIGLFQIGKNPYVDKLAFKCGTMPVNLEYAYVGIIGKPLNKGPETYKDVLENVKTDCLKERKRQAFESLKKKYRVEINQRVLKTVNCSGKY